MNKKGYIILCILVVLFILAIIVLFEKYVISANLQEGATNNFSSYFVPIEEVKKEQNKALNSTSSHYLLASTVFLTKNPSEKPNINVFADYTYYLVINPADVPDMESTLNYLTLTDLPKVTILREYLSEIEIIDKEYDAKNNNIWETTTQEFAIPFVLNGSSDSSWLKGTDRSNEYINNIPNAYGLQLKFGTMDFNDIGMNQKDGLSFDMVKQYGSGNQFSFGSQILLKSKEDIIQNPFLYKWFTNKGNIKYLGGEVIDEGVYWNDPIHYYNVAEDDILNKNLSSTDSGSTGLFVGYIDKLSYISKTDMQNADVSNEIEPTILNKKIPVYLVKGDFNPYKSKPKPVSYFDTSSYCDGDKIYIAAKSTQISKTQEDEESCAKKCEDNENCDMYLMQEKDGKNTCYTYKDVSGISMYCNQGNDPEPHMYWGKVKSNVKDNIVRYPESTAELEAQQKAQQEQGLAQQEAQKAQQEQGLAKEESEEEAKFTSEEAKLTSEEAKFTSEKAKLTSEEAKADSLQAKLALYSKTISNLRGQLATCGKKPMLLMDDKPSLKPCKSTTKTHIIPQADDLINIHFSNRNIKI